MHSEPAKLILLNKPWGVVSQFSGSDNNLSSLVNIPNVYPAGRLDKDSEGLMLLTDQGWLQHQISHPRNKMRKTYWVQVDGQINTDALSLLRSGVNLKDGTAQALEAQAMAAPGSLWPRHPPVRERKHIPTSWLKLTIAQGRNRQVRRMTAAVGYPTLRLIRAQIGPWSLNEIPSGQFRIEHHSSIAKPA